MKKKFDLDALKQNYEILRKKYKLPSFDEINKEFDIEKLQEKESDFMLREIRRCIGDKIAAFLRFFEMLVNPQTAPIFILYGLKSLAFEEKNKIEKIYRELAMIEINLINLDIEENEKEEAEIIKTSLKKWNELKPSLKEVNSILRKIIQGKTEKTKEKSYFG